MWFNPIIKFLLTSPLHFFVSGNMMLLNFTGRKSGKAFSTPVNYVTIGDDLYTTSVPERTWWRNFRGGGPAEIVMKGKRLAYTGTSYEGVDAVMTVLPGYLAHAPKAVADYYGVAPDSPPEMLAEAAAKLVLVRFSLA